MDLIIREGRALWGDQTFECTLGKEGLSGDKREGDLKTPIGVFPFRSVYWRSDRIPLIESVLPHHAITRTCGWCDDPDHPDYNRFVTLPFSAGHEKLWREDFVYDLILTVGHNDSPPVPGKGSAVFVHLMRENKAPTEGCVAFHRKDLLYILKTCSPSSRLIVEP